MEKLLYTTIADIDAFMYVIKNFTENCDPECVITFCQSDQNNCMNIHNANTCVNLNKDIFAQYYCRDNFEISIDIKQFYDALQKLSTDINLSMIDDKNLLCYNSSDVFNLECNKFEKDNTVCDMVNHSKQLYNNTKNTTDKIEKTVYLEDLLKLSNASQYTEKVDFYISAEKTMVAIPVKSYGSMFFDLKQSK